MILSHVFASRLSGAKAQSYGFLPFLCHTAGVLAPNVEDTQEYYARVCVCVRAHPLGVKSCGVYLTVREHPPFSLSVESRERERGEEK